MATQMDIWEAAAEVVQGDQLNSNSLATYESVAVPLGARPLIVIPSRKNRVIAKSGVRSQDTIENAS